jgi:hypothetical protein
MKVKTEGDQFGIWMVGKAERTGIVERCVKKV